MVDYNCFSDLCAIYLSTIDNFFLLFCHLPTFFKIIFFKLFQEYHKSVKQFGYRSGPDILSGLIWVQIVFKNYQQMTLGGKELNMGIQLSKWDRDIVFGLSLHLHPTLPVPAAKILARL